MLEAKTKISQIEPMVPSVSHAIAILRHLGNSRKSQGVTLIARDLGLSASSCFNLLRTLVYEGWVDFDFNTKHYSLGQGVTELIRLSASRSDVISLTLPHLQLVADRYSAACGLWRQTVSKRLSLIALSESDAATRIHMVVGQRQPLLAGAAGRALAAFSQDAANVLEANFELIRWQKSFSFQDYLTELAQTREQGFAIDRDLYFRGITTVAAPIFDKLDNVSFIISASMFSGQHNLEDAKIIGVQLKAAAAEIARRLYQ